jgi:hypothetical protein
MTLLWRGPQRPALTLRPQRARPWLPAGTA